MRRHGSGCDAGTGVGPLGVTRESAPQSPKGGEWGGRARVPECTVITFTNAEYLILTKAECLILTKAECLILAEQKQNVLGLQKHNV